MTQHHMQRSDRQINDQQEIQELLKQGSFVTLALALDNRPYAVTMNYGYDSKHNVLYFHSACAGLKLDIVRANKQVCATLIDDLGYVAGECSHRYRSVVVFGKMEEVDSLEEKKHAFSVLVDQFEEDGQSIKERMLDNDAAYASVAILRLDIEQITAKHGS